MDINNLKISLHLSFLKFRMKTKQVLALSVVSTLIISLASCLSSSDQKGLSEGIIEYEAVAVDQSNPMANMAPSKMTVKFKENKMIAQMSAGMGVVSLSIVSDPDSRSLMEMVKVFTSKAAHVSDSNDVKMEMKNMPKIKIEETNDTKVIAGYKCKRAVVTYVELTDRAKYDIYYTDELDIKNSNWANAYYAIEGVLMEYQVDRYGMEMRFTASKVSKTEIDNSVFDLPKDYKLISGPEMNDIFKSLQ